MSLLPARSKAIILTFRTDLLTGVVLGLKQSDHINRMLTLTVILLISFCCMIKSMLFCSHSNAFPTCILLRSLDLLFHHCCCSQRIQTHIFWDNLLNSFSDTLRQPVELIFWSFSYILKHYFLIIICYLNPPVEF